MNQLSSPGSRDFTGYGREPPHPRWPGDARIAVQFVINYEEGAENCILNGDAASEAFLSDIAGAVPWPGERHMNMESLYEYGARAGFWRLWRAFTSRGLPATVFGVAKALAQAPEQVAAMKQANWEIASHGLRWIEYGHFAEAEERAHILEAVQIHTEVTGERPLGFYHGRCSVNTLNLTMAEGGFLYSADSYADDLPYWVAGPVRAVPDRAVYARGQRHALRRRAGLQFGRPVLHLSEGHVRRAVSRRRDFAENDVGGPALPADRPAGTRGGPGAVPGLRPWA